jgi:hypothetical protein
MLRYNTTNDEWEDTQGIRVDLNGDVVIGGGNAYSASYDVTVNGGLAVTGGGFIDGGVLLGATVAQSFLSQGAAQFDSSMNWPGFIYSTVGLDLIILTSGVQPFRVLSCDAELKENIRDLDYGVEQVRAGPRARRFDTKDGSTRGAVGFIAQEMRQVIPEAFIDVEERYDEEGNKIGEAGIGMSSLPILATLWNTVQDLAQEVEDLRNAQ